ncbi:L,D-transpeptidase [Alkalilacustris brevis]|uniref:L,D-transpeptidase n=1 Tax=Alkalilacustris brevis TaxID=2026338 RepID=UPI000E0DB7E3|nr:L,D-transpeptidase [Alkalilacustris brevis]
MSANGIGRRRVLAMGGAAALSSVALPLRAQNFTGAIEGETGVEATASERARRNIQGFRNVRWQDHFDHLRNGAILCDTASRALHYWSADESIYLLHPCSVPMSEEFIRRGRTSIVEKRPNPTWIPTPNMRERDPSLPAIVHPGPDNPLGTRAMNLGWTYYRIHGIDNPAKIGRKASNGCFGLYNEDVEVLYELAVIGTQVVVI